MAASKETYPARSTVTCPCCGRSVKTTKSGGMVQHGYTRAGGLYRPRGCAGHTAASDFDALTAHVAALTEDHAALCEAAISGSRKFAARDAAASVKAEIERIAATLA